MNTTFNSISHSIFNYINYSVIKIIMIYIVYILSHTLSSNIYIYYCTPFTWKGILLSPIMIVSPHCKTMLWIINHTSYNIETMWILIGTFICSNIISKLPNIVFTKHEPKIIQ
jgi:hypothetical protein